MSRPLERQAVSIYRRSRLAPLLRAALTGALFRSGYPDVSHLAFYEEDRAVGPLQRDEALLLYGAVRAIRPKTVVEFGFLHGHSAFNFLRAMDVDAALYSFDISPESQGNAQAVYGHDPRFRFVLKSQEDVNRGDIDGRSIDLLFIDASHDLALNQSTFSAVKPLLSPRALVAVHDTGAWPREFVTSWPEAVAYASENPDLWLADGRLAHQADERRFVNWIGSTWPEFAQIHFHSDTTMRHGLTLLQGGGPLTTPE